MEIQNLEALVKKYQDAIHSQDKEAFYDLWAKNVTCSLVQYL